MSATATMPAPAGTKGHDHAEHDHGHHHHAHGGGCCSSSNSAVAEAPMTAAPTVSTGPCPVTVTERAASEVRRHIADMQNDEELAGKPLYLRLRVQGGGCSGFQNKLDLDPTFNEKIDSLFEAHGVQIVIDKRSLLYLQGATVDFHDDLNKRGFSVTNPSAKGTCGCGSSYAM